MTAHDDSPPSSSADESLAAASARDGAITPPPASRARVLAAVAGERTPSRAAISLRNALAFLLGLAVALGAFFYMGGLRAGPRPSSLIVETAVGATLIALVAAWQLIGRGGSMLGRPPRWLVLAICATPVLLFLWKVGVSNEYDGMMVRWAARPGLRCLGLSTTSGGAILAALLVIRGGTAPRNPAMTGAGLGVAAGACAWVLVDLWCPVGFVPHLLLGHVAPLVLLAIVGTLVGRRVLAQR